MRAIKVYGDNAAGMSCAMLKSAQRRGQSWGSRPGRLTPRTKTPGIHLNGRRMDSRDGLKLMRVRKASAYVRNSSAIPRYITAASSCISSQYDVNNTCSRYVALIPISGPLKRSGHYMYRQFNIQQFYVLPEQCIYVFCEDLRTNSDYFPIQH